MCWFVLCSLPRVRIMLNDCYYIFSLKFQVITLTCMEDHQQYQVGFWVPFKFTPNEAAVNEKILISPAPE